MSSIKEFINRINGFSTPIGGISWQPKEEEEKIIYKLIQKISNRRILDYSHGIINKTASIKSIEILRNDLTLALIDLGQDSKIVGNIESVRLILKEFQTFIEHQTEIDGKGNIQMSGEFIKALDFVRSSVNGSMAIFTNGGNKKLSLPKDINGNSSILKIT